MIKGLRKVLFRKGLLRNLRVKKEQAENLLFLKNLRSLDSAGLQAIGADMHSLGAAIHFALYVLDIRFPHCIGSSMRMADIITEKYALTTNITLSHFDTSSTPAYWLYAWNLFTLMYNIRKRMENQVKISFFIFIFIIPFLWESC